MFLVTIAACQAGKDIYVEKPLSNFIGEGKFAIEAAKKYNRIAQIGTQQRSWEQYKKAVEIVQSGELGAISEVKVWDYSNWYPGKGSPADCDPPAELNWDFYVGPSPFRNYNPNIYYDYGYDWFKLSGAGHQVAWGVHHFDIVNWAMGVTDPVSAVGMGGKFAMPDDNREWPDTFDGIVEYGPRPRGKGRLPPAIHDAHRRPSRLPRPRQVLHRVEGFPPPGPQRLHDHGGRERSRRR